MYQQKVEGQTCSDCGQGKYVKNPKTGKIFCENKCWLNGGQQQTAPVSPKTAPSEPKIDNSVWESKDRLHAAQTALNCAANIFQGKSVPSSTITSQANEYYAWLRNKQLGGTSTEDEFELPPNL